MKNYLINCIRRPFGCLILFCTFCTCKEPAHYNSFTPTRAESLALERMAGRAFDSILKMQALIRTGDLITRTGNDFTSESLRSLNQRDQTYSHCGIASIENDSIFVYHALGGEWNPNQKIRRDPLYLFGDPYNNRGMAIFRYEIDDSTCHQIYKTTHRYFTEGIMFDMDFDLATDHRMYCAEFVCKSYEKGSHGKLQFPHSRIKDFEFIGVDDLFLHPKCTKRAQIVYK